jgi:hypothetical protein
MHEHHQGHQGHHHGGETADGRTESLRRVLTMLDHWIEHGESHADEYREWAAKADAAGEAEVAREVHLAIEAGATVTAHLKRARAILAAKLVLKK